MNLEWLRTFQKEHPEAKRPSMIPMGEEGKALARFRFTFTGNDPDQRGIIILTYEKKEGAWVRTSVSPERYRPVKPVGETTPLPKPKVTPEG